LKGGGVKPFMFFAIVLFIIAFAFIITFMVKAKKFGFRQTLRWESGFLVGAVFFSFYGLIFLLCC
jgi:hypothetical protein